MTLPVPCQPANTLYYIGVPPNMVQFIMPDAYYTTPLNASIVDHSLVGGGTATQRMGSIKRRYVLTFTARAAEDADLITSIYYGMLGPGPYYFIDPIWRNVLTGHVSGTGKKQQNTAGLIATAGTLAYSTAIAPPVTASGTKPGVQVWTGAGNGSALYLGATAAGVLETSAPPCQQNLLPIGAGISLKTASSTASVSLQLYFNDSTGALISAVTLGTITANTGWQLVAGSIAASAVPATAVTFGLKLLCNTAGAPAIHLSAPLAQYAQPGALALPPWVLGIGVPRMNIGTSVPASHAKSHLRKTQALDLVEA